MTQGTECIVLSIISVVWRSKTRKCYAWQEQNFVWHWWLDKLLIIIEKYPERLQSVHVYVLKKGSK